MDLNLLRVFCVIYREGNLTQAAQALNLTQPTLSHALGRLRRHFGDDLFVRKGRGLVPTVRSDELYALCGNEIGNLERVWQIDEAFSPSESTRTFRIALTDLGEMDFLPRIIAKFRLLAPHASLEVIPLDITTITFELQRGQVDAAITSTLLEGTFASALLKNERYVVVRKAEDPVVVLPESAIQLSEISDHPLVLVRPQMGHHAPITAIERHGVAVNVALTVQTFAAVPRILRSTPLNSIVPETIAQGWVERWGLSYASLPPEIPALNVRLYWPSHRSDSEFNLDEGRAWFVDLIRAVV